MISTRLLGIACLLVSMVGCASLDIKNWSFRDAPRKASSTNPVSEILCLWEPGDGRGLDGLPARGFAGQILFFTAGFPDPVVVEGHVRIYIFDDVGTEEEQSKPIHQFDFEPGVWKSFQRETNLGTAYQLFIPYTRSGNQKAECSVRVRLTPDNGLPVYSKMATVILRGAHAENVQAAKPITSTTKRTTTQEAPSVQLPQQRASLHEPAGMSSADPFAVDPVQLASDSKSSISPRKVVNRNLEPEQPPLPLDRDGNPDPFARISSMLDQNSSTDTIGNSIRLRSADTERHSSSATHAMDRESAHPIRRSLEQIDERDDR